MGSKCFDCDKHPCDGCDSSFENRCWRCGLVADKLYKVGHRQGPNYCAECAERLRADDEAVKRQLREVRE